MINELPTIGASTYASSAVQLDQLGAFGANAANQPIGNLLQQLVDRDINRMRSGQLIMPRSARHAAIEEAIASAGEESMPAARRLVKVVIVDPNENIPLDQCLLYSGEEQLTDATDTELFYDIDIKTLLATHNERRTKVRDKAIKERTEYLEPAKIRDLKMVVVNIAAF